MNALNKPHRSSLRVVPERAPSALARFHAVAFARGEDPSELLEEFARSWLAAVGAEEAAPAAPELVCVDGAGDVAEPEGLMTPEEAATFLRKSRSWLYAAVERLEVPAMRIGRSLRFRRSDLADWGAKQASTDKTLIAGSRRRQPLRTACRDG